MLVSCLILHDTMSRWLAMTMSRWLTVYDRERLSASLWVTVAINYKTSSIINLLYIARDLYTEVTKYFLCVFTFVNTQVHWKKDIKLPCIKVSSIYHHMLNASCSTSFQAQCLKCLLCLSGRMISKVFRAKQTSSSYISSTQLDGGGEKGWERGRRRQGAREDEVETLQVVQERKRKKKQLIWFSNNTSQLSRPTTAIETALLKM